MYLVRCLVFISIFLISTSDHKVQVKGCFVGSVLLDLSDWLVLLQMQDAFPHQ